MSKLVLPKALVIGALAVAGLGLVHAQPESEERPLGDFSRLRVQDGIDVYLRQSDEPRLRLEVEGYEIEDVVAEIDGDELILRRESEGWGWGGFFGGRDIRAYVDFVQLSAIRALAGADIEGRNELLLEDLVLEASAGSDVELSLQARNLEARVSSGSDLRLRGNAQSLTVEASSGSDVSARSLEVERVRLRLSSGSDAEVRATAAVEIDARSGSDVDVYGDPAQRTHDSDKSSDIRWH